MRLATITNWAYGSTVLLTLLSGGTMLLASSAHERERAAVAQRHALHRAGSEVSRDLFQLTDHARQLVATGDPTYRILYRRDRRALATIDARIRPLAQAGATPEALATLREAIRWTDALQDEQSTAIAAFDRGDLTTARAIMFGAEHERELDRAQALVERFAVEVDARAANRIESATQVARLWRTVSELVIGITALLFLAVLYFIFKRRVLRPVVRLSDVVSRLAAQDFSAEPPELTQIDEIGDMAQAVRVFRENGLERQRLEAERERELAVREALSRMTQRMQGCDTLSDLVEVVQRFVPEVVPGLAGKLYLLDSERGELDAACAWQAPTRSLDRFAPSDCWALRRGQPHRPAGAAVDVPCGHLQGETGAAPADTICLPLMTHGETVGMLFFEPGHDAAAAPPPEAYLRLLAENIGLALANLRLSEALRAMAMTDTLTGLANRRHLEARLPLLLADAHVPGAPLSCIILDIDHFKRFNDMHGHDAGDTVLRAVGHVLADVTRGDGEAFRQGGEEFVLLLPAPLEIATARAEDIRARIAALDLSHDGVLLGPVSLSAGIAASPLHCAPERLIATADAALLRAKERGRDRIEIALQRAA